MTPPSIVGSRLVSPRDGGGIELTFSEPMDPASVENPANYAVSENSHRPNTLDLASFLLSGSVEDHSAKVKITSATYDPAARTVTLGPCEAAQGRGAIFGDDPPAASLREGTFRAADHGRQVDRHLRQSDQRRHRE